MNANEKTTVEKGLTRMLSIVLPSDDPQEREAAKFFNPAIAKAG